MGIFSIFKSRKSSSDRRYHKRSHKGSRHYRKGYDSSRRPRRRRFTSFSSMFSMSSSWS